MSRNPVTWAAGISGVLTALVTVGVLNADQAANVNSDVQVLVGLAGFLIPFVAGLLAHRKVTPLADPRDNAGRRLTPDGATPISG